ncbi:MAG: D-aminoacyl-tRNA deacylase [Roseburia sp.]|nr:D-aminoacyl-tRNA deacylase [Roseburia sp.]
MKAVVQRVRQATLTVNGQLISQIDGGLVVFLGVKQGDSEQQTERMAYKIANLRIFEDGAGKMNLSVKEVGGSVLLVSQFTLYGDCSHGNRPSFSTAEEPVRAKELYELCAEKLRGFNLTVKTGVFGADMKISQLNDGPVSIILEI